MTVLDEGCFPSRLSETIYLPLSAVIARALFQRPKQSPYPQQMSLRGGTTKQSPEDYYFCFMYKLYYVYILTNKNNTVLYTGVTNDLRVRVYQHKNKMNKGFTARYNIYKLVYFETFEGIDNAIHREKVIKGGSRKKKIDLIISMNPD